MPRPQKAFQVVKETPQMSVETFLETKMKTKNYQNQDDREGSHA